MYIVSSIVLSFVFLVVMEVVMPYEECKNSQDMEPYWWSRIVGGLMIFFIWPLVLGIGIVIGILYLIHRAAVRVAQRIQRKLNAK